MKRLVLEVFDPPLYMREFNSSSFLNTPCVVNMITAQVVVMGAVFYDDGDVS